MKRWLTLAMLLAFLPQTTTALAAGPAIGAASAILMDGDTGRVLWEKDAHTSRPIASITKLMTALVAVESTRDLSRKVTVKREWTLAEGSSIYLREGETLSLETLLYGLLLNSGNDAALAVAESCAGSVETFVEWMNRRAADLGMEHTHFTNPSGLSEEGHYSSAYDMAMLARACLERSELRLILGTRSIALEGHSFANHNKLLWQYEGCIGLKTGYTQAAGRTLVSAAEHRGQTVICVTLDDPDDWKDHKALLDYGFSAYPRHILAKAKKTFRRVPVEGSLLRFVEVETSHDVFYPLREEETVRAELLLPERVTAPVKAGTVAGSLTFYQGEEEIGRTYLLYARNVEDHTATPWSPFSIALDLLRDKDRPLSALYPVSVALGYILHK